MHVHMSARKDLENKVSMYVASIMPSDMGLAVKILEEAIVDGVTEEALCQKFPGFKEYVEINPKSARWRLCGRPPSVYCLGSEFNRQKIAATPDRDPGSTAWIPDRPRFACSVRDGAIRVCTKNLFHVIII